MGILGRAFSLLHRRNLLALRIRFQQSAAILHCRPEDGDRNARRSLLHYQTAERLLHRIQKQRVNRTEIHARTENKIPDAVHRDSFRHLLPDERQISGHRLDRYGRTRRIYVLQQRLLHHQYPARHARISDKQPRTRPISRPRTDPMDRNQRRRNTAHQGILARKQRAGSVRPHRPAATVH